MALSCKCDDINGLSEGYNSKMVITPNKKARRTLGAFVARIYPQIPPFAFQFSPIIIKTLFFSTPA